jgi:GT2 family glycosyltransferase
MGDHKPSEIGEPNTGPAVSICVLTYGNYPDLAKRCIESIRSNCNRSLYRLIVGANAPSVETEDYLRHLHTAAAIDRLIISRSNINKCPMMRQMFASVTTEYIWWFDDDSFITEPNAIERWLEIASTSPATVAHWGHQFYFGHEQDFSYGADVVSFVKESPWYRGKAPPSWKPGGKGEYDFERRGTGDGRWFFVTGGCWMIRASAIKALDWPDPRLVKRNDDVFLGEALRQQGLEARDIGPLGVVINTGPRRGEGEDQATMNQQVNGCRQQS